jgi:hypothetical protein
MARWIARLLLALWACGALPASSATMTSTWLGGPGSWEDATRWSAGVPDNTATDSFGALIDGDNPVASQVTLDSAATVDSLRVDPGDSLVVTPSGALAVVDQIENAGTIVLQKRDATFALTGWDTMVLSGGGSVILDGVEEFVSTNLDNRISGWGTTLVGSGNYGVIEANVPGKELSVRAAYSLPRAINYGTMRAVGGGILWLRSTLENRGTVAALDGSEIHSEDFLYSRHLLGATPQHDGAVG